MCYCWLNKQYWFSSREDLLSLRSVILLKKEALAKLFSCEFYEIYKNPFLTEHLWTTASVLYNSVYISFLYKTVQPRPVELLVYCFSFFLQKSNIHQMLQVTVSLTREYNY